MTFDVVAIREHGDADPVFGMLPVLDAASPLGVARENPDGALPSRFVATGLSVLGATREAGEPIAGLTKVDIAVALTDQRLIVRCVQYDKGGGTWYGFGPVEFAVALGLNALARANARRRTEGTEVVGHIRYQWIDEVSYAYTGGLFGGGMLRVGLVDGTTEDPRRLWLVLDLAGGSDPAIATRELLRRVIRCWTTQDVPVEGLDRDAIASVGSRPARRSEWDGHLWHSWELPLVLQARPETAWIFDAEFIAEMHRARQRVQAPRRAAASLLLS